MNLLRELQTERKAQHDHAMEEAKPLAQLNLINGLPYQWLRLFSRRNQPRYRPRHDAAILHRKGQLDSRRWIQITPIENKEVTLLLSVSIRFYPWLNCLFQYPARRRVSLPRALPSHHRTDPFRIKPNCKLARKRAGML